MKDNKHIIWSNYDIDPNEWDLSDYEELNNADEFKKYSFCAELNYEYLEDERDNLNIKLSNDIIAIADLGLWYGRFSAYKELGNNIKDILYCNYDYTEWYTDKYNLCCKESHHDGTNYITYRVFKDITDTQKENFLNKLWSGKATKKDITRYTCSLLPYVKEVYGY